MFTPCALHISGPRFLSALHLGPTLTLCALSAPSAFDNYTIITLASNPLFLAMHLYPYDHLKLFHSSISITCYHHSKPLTLSYKHPNPQIPASNIMKQQLATKIQHQWSKLKTHTSTLPFPLRLNHASS
ncbi:hypothetical protein HanIR_Chr14g0703501 [Helianthus annuus]|nr:hypothetical protein HanIR_Chr14g0703501 [Helianthus annuus]